MSLACFTRHHQACKTLHLEIQCNCNSTAFLSKRAKTTVKMCKAPCRKCEEEVCGGGGRGAIGGGHCTAVPQNAEGATVHQHAGQTEARVQVTTVRHFGCLLDKQREHIHNRKAFPEQERKAPLTCFMRHTVRSSVEHSSPFLGVRIRNTSPVQPMGNIPSHRTEID